MDHKLPEFQKGAKRPEGWQEDWVQCGHCKRWWDDSLTTSIIPVPAGRCPFEYEHEYKMRPLEVAICLADHTWYDGVYIEIPADTPEDQIERVASEITLKHVMLQDVEVAKVWVYNTMEDEVLVKIPD